MTLCIKRFSNPDVEEKLNAMRMCGVHLGKFIEYTILNFDVESYLKERIEDAKCEWILNPGELEEEPSE